MIKLTELEAIQLTIKNGFNGEELESAKFKKLGCLDGAKDKMTGEFNNRAMIKFLRKLETLFENVSVEGKGKKRTYTLSNAKLQQSQIQDNRKFNGFEEHDYVIAKHVFNRLLEMNTNRVKSAYEWAIDCNALNPSHINKEMVQKHFYDVFLGEDAEQVYNGFQYYMKNNNRSMINKAFKYLEHNNLIKVTNHYSCVKLDGLSVEIDKNTYDLFTLHKTAILNKYNVSAHTYKYMRFNEMYVEMFGELEQLYDDMKMKLVYVSHSVEVLNTNGFDNININDFMEAYYTQLIEKMGKLQSKSNTDYVNLYNSFKSFSLLSTLTIIIKDDERLNQLVSNKTPEFFRVYLILNDRYKKQVKMSERFLQELDEMELMLSGVSVEKVEESPIEQTTKPLTIDDVIDFTDITEGELLDTPNTYNMIEFKEEVKEENTYNEELVSALNMIKLAFSVPVSQCIGY